MNITITCECGNEETINITESDWERTDELLEKFKRFNIYISGDGMLGLICKCGIDYFIC